MKLFNIITIYPDFFESFKNHGLINKGLSEKIIDLNILNLRHFTVDKHKRVDFKPYGGGPGMVIQYEPVKNALDSDMFKTIEVSKLTKQKVDQITKLTSRLPNRKDWMKNLGKKQIILRGRGETGKTYQMLSWAYEEYIENNKKIVIDLGTIIFFKE